MLVQSDDHKVTPLHGHKSVLPPGFSAEAVSEPWQHALSAAAAGQAPGTLAYATEGGLLEAGLILTPDQPVDDQTVLRMATLAMRDALAAAVPPETVVAVTAAGQVTVNQGEVARLTLARGPTLADGTPAWMVLGFTVRMALQLDAPGLTPWLTDLAEEGVAVSNAALLEAVCRHLLAAVDLWQDEGAPGIDHAWQALQAVPA